MKLKPCPFCGLTSNTDWEDILHPSGVGWRRLSRGDRGLCKSYLGRNRIDLWEGACYKINCATTYGGCGANISGDSEEEVIDRWNKRMPTNNE